MPMVFFTSFIDSWISQFLDKVFGCPKGVTETCVTNAKPIYFSFPYFRPFSEKLKQNLLTLLSKYYTIYKFCVILVNNFTIGSFLNYKDKLPLHLWCSLVYKYSCVHCTSEHVGMTTHTLGTRVAEHAGVCFQSGVVVYPLQVLHTQLCETVQSCVPPMLTSIILKLIWNFKILIHF